MATTSRLPPCCHGVLLSHKDTPKVRFKSELAKYAAPNAKSDALPRLAAALTDARSALYLDRSGGDASATALAAKFKTMDDIQQYLAAIQEYLSLVKGFTVAPTTLLSDAQPPLTDSALNPVATVAANGSTTPKAGLMQPLIDNQSPTAKRSGVISAATSRSKCLSCCSWKDVLSNTNAYAPNARIEQAQVLLASGLAMMTASRATVDAMLAERVTEINENQLKISYQLQLHAAGVLEACLRALDRTPQSIGASAASTESTSTAATPAAEANGGGDEALEKWRDEQRRASQPPTATAPTPAASEPVAASASDDFAMLGRIPDLSNGRFPQVMAWVALAQAQELVILRAISREFVDYSLLARLAIDVAHRYKDTHAYAARHLPCGSSPVADRLRLYCSFKDAYYTAVSCYFQGAACMKTEDGRHCAMAIADLKKASVLIQEATRRKSELDARADKADKDRQFAIKTVYVRAEQIIQRDLEIATRRNDSIYYERIPEPEAASEPHSLVRPVEFPAVEFHAYWHDPDILGCLQPPDTSAATGTNGAVNGAVQSRPAGSAGHTQESGPRRDGCCDSCVIS